MIVDLKRVQIRLTTREEFRQYQFERDLKAMLHETKKQVYGYVSEAARNCGLRWAHVYLEDYGVWLKVR